MNVIGHRKIFYVFSVILIGGALTAVSIGGLRFGIDFLGGTILEVEFTGVRPSLEDIYKRIQPLHLGEVRLQPSGEHNLFLRLPHIGDEMHRVLISALSGNTSDTLVEKRFDSIGPTIGRELRRKSVIAIGLVMVLIVSYIAWAFRKVSAPVESWKYGITTVVALLHDVIIPTGFFTILGRFFGFEIDTLFVTALLTILGFSVHDTIVVFDRIRENLKKNERKIYFPDLVNQSVNETFMRSINTSLTVVLALLAVYIFGGETTRVFSLTLIIGVIVGTYSSIFIASPLLVTWYQRSSRLTLKNQK